MNIKLPDYAEKLLSPMRYKVLHGGRGSAKSYTVARLLLLKGANSRRKVLCAREFQNSIHESVHTLLKEQAEKIGLDKFYSFTNQSIVGNNGTEFMFKGVRQNVDSIKSIPSITDLWLEEAHTISKRSWDTLIPTIREEGSEIWVTFNPNEIDDPTYTMFLNKDGTPVQRDDAVVIKVNWDQNPWFPDVLKKEKDHLFKVNPDLADHVWNGNCRKNSHAQIFRNKWKVAEFEPQPGWDGPYFGADWGFSTDPMTLVKIYLDTDNRRLMIRKAEFIWGCELDYIPDFFDRIEGSRNHKIRADNARPETISHVKRRGFDIEAADKWPGSVEDGVEWLRTWNEIIIHPDCEHTNLKRGDEYVNYGMITEAKNYSYKVDRLTEDVLTDIVDAYNHGWDGARYAMQPLITKSSSILDLF